ncbi:lytic transglycosylase domain-containing protein [Tritonibacter multivorans]|nr:lytic transglycosylase domain-containing protein [Tritonibacter multivorans]
MAPRSPQRAGSWADRIWWSGVCVCATVLALTAEPLAAQDAAPAEAASKYDDFTAKRIRPPKPGSGRLITIQIDPAEQAARLSRRTESDDPPAEETDSTAATPVPQEARFAWFWEEVSPALEAASAGRLETALEVIAAHPEVTAPRLQQMQDIVNAYGIDILTGTLGTQVSPAWVLAVIAVESSGRADAVSSAGAQGLMQLMPETAVEHGVTDPFTPKDNIAGGVRFIDQLMALYGGDPMLVAAAYNAGPGAVRDHDGVPPYTETRDYVPKVLAAYQMARSLCRTPPIMISDGCIFHSMN